MTPKQETLEDFAKREANDNEKHGHVKLGYQDGVFYGILTGAKWQREKHTNKEELGKFAFDRFIAGAKSDTSRDYWYSKFKQELGQEVGHSVQVEAMYSEEEVLKLLINFSNERTFLKKNVAIRWFEQYKKQEALDLDELESKLDNSLSKETRESLTKWLGSKRVDDDFIDDEWLIKEKHKETLEFGEWLLANEIDFIDNTPEGNIYEYNGLRLGFTIKDLHEFYLKQNN
jgi:hypothetical protein